MLVSIWRHGEAGPGSPDRKRILTERGHADIERGARAYVGQLQYRGLPLPGRLFFSRWQRTKQTADGLLTALPTTTSEPLEALIPDSDTVSVDHAVAAYTEREAHVLLVSHQPLVSQLVDRWLGTRNDVPALAPGAYAVLDMPVAAPGCASLVWWSSPPEYRV